MKYNILDLSKELAQSKINININDLNKENKFLVSRNWDCLDDNKIFELDIKVESIFKELNKKNIEKLTSDINNNFNLEHFYNSYNPMVNMHNIGCVCSINCLVESKYSSQDMSKESKLYDLTELSPYIYKFRNILGDGECFYRGLIFSILENIILTNNIMQLKELLILYYTKINKNNKLIKEKDYLKIIEQMNIDIVSEILFLLIKQMEDDIKKAYIILLKAFIFYKDFDFGIIFFTRYLIYEYISTNEDKIYSKECQLEVGCLLPDDYIIEKGNKNEYFFENFYTLELMCPKVFAEKIVLYIVPYVFNINMNILVYDFGINGEKSIIQEKEFSNENKSIFQIQINLLFRKAHYDVYYKLNYYEDYKGNLNILIYKKEDLDNFEKRQIHEVINENRIQIENSSNDFWNKSNINNTINNIDNNNININKENFKKDKDGERDIKDDFDINNKYINIQEKDNLPDNKNNSPRCLECYLPYGNEENVFGLCDNCLLNNIKTLLLTSFFEFIKDKKNLINSREKFREILKQKKYTISVQDNVSVFEAIFNSKFNFNELFITVRNQLCLYCGNTIKTGNQYFIELPCKCKICSQRCFNGYMNVIQQHIMQRKEYNPKLIKYINLLSCFCGLIYNTQDVLYMIKELEKYEFNSQKKIYQDYILNFWNLTCFLCKNNFTKKKKFGKITFKCEDIDKNLLDSKTKFEHCLCTECFYESNFNFMKIINCNICELDHEIIKLVKVNEYNEEEEENYIF